MTNQNTTVRVARNAARVSVLPKAAVAGGAALRVYKKYLPNVQKRDGRIVPFEFDKVVNAIHKAMLATNEGSEDEAVVVAHKVAGGKKGDGEKPKKFSPPGVGGPGGGGRRVICDGCA